MSVKNKTYFNFKNKTLCTFLLFPINHVFFNVVVLLLLNDFSGTHDDDRYKDNAWSTIKHIFFCFKDFARKSSGIDSKDVFHSSKPAKRIGLSACVISKAAFSL